MMNKVYLAIGTNKGLNLKYNLDKSILLLSKYLKITKKSSQIITKPLEMISKHNFLNQVLEIETDLAPMVLLKVLQKIEYQMGRTAKGQYQDRVIDIDILSYEQVILRTNILCIPHKKMHLRSFVLRPLQEITPCYRHPLTKKTIDEMLEKINN
ncbi:MAG: 2-amino-4-hydroxy-6-hydroxymethyldihydropteridine diphosphokinase [bacterium]|nr:2-amino-4-hydroxy-6-hydroxymethyldihydropteridine diphosphokinase [bacterium]